MRPHKAVSLLTLLAVTAWGAAAAESAAFAELKLLASDRVLVLAPHPDDEVLGCAGLIQQAHLLNVPLHVVWLTYGDANQWAFTVNRKHPVLLPTAVRQMGELRHGEALAAASVLGVQPASLRFLGYPDFGTLAIWNEHWGSAPPYRSLLTHATAVPYADAYRPGAPYKGEELLRDITSVLREFRPTKIFVSHPADHNGDHRALYLFTRVALWDLERELQPAPALYPYLIHYVGWPRPRGQRLQDPLSPPPSLRDSIAWQTLRLSLAQLERKLAALRAHHSQFVSSSGYLLSFVRPNELFGDLPEVSTEAVDTREAPAAKPDRLTAAERAAFIGMTRQSVRLEHDQLVVSIELSRPLARQVELSIYAFGYRRDRPFAVMPKLQVRIGEIRHALLDQRHKLPADILQLSRSARGVVVRLPLAALGQPERILISARTSLAELPLDWTPWRVLKLADGDQPRPGDRAD